MQGPEASVEARRIFSSLGNGAEVPRLHAGVPLGPPSVQGMFLRLCQGK